MLALGFFDRDNGVFYASENKGALLASNFIGAMTIIGWTILCSSVFFLLTKKCLRVSKTIERAGIDFEETMNLDVEIKKFFIEIMK